MSTIPKIDLRTIKARIDGRSYERGEKYYRDGAIFDPRRQGMTIKARCEGSQGGPYRVQVHFEGKGIADAECSCPVGSGGHCKHVAALLLTWRAKPEEFVEVEALEASLERRSKPEMVALIKQMLKRQPDLESLLETPLPGTGKRTRPANPETYRRQASAAFRGYGYDDWGSGASIAGELETIREIGGGFLEQGDFSGASAVFEGLLRAVTEDYETIDDEGGELFGVAAACIAGLGRCLTDLKDDPARREAVLRALFDAFDFTRNYGDIDEGVPELVAKHATEEERGTVVNWVREEMAKKGSDYGSDYRRRAFADFLLTLEGDRLDDDAYLKICRDAGLTEDLIDRLLTLGRLDEAVQALAKVQDYSFLALADLFVGHKQGEVAERLVRERLGKKKDIRMLEWLKRRASARRDKATERELARTIFDLQPTFEGYQGLRKLLPKADWEDFRAKLLDQLRTRKDSHLLIKILLSEGELDQAIEALKAARHGSGMELEVARAAEKARPLAAIEIYKKAAERHIDYRSRDQYREGCRYLKKVKDLYAQAGQSREWAYDIGVLRERFRGLPALMDEMAKAKL